jgi:spermidine synthase
VVLGLFVRLPKTFDYDKLATGTNVYFKPSPHGHVIAHAESLDGGLTTVNETRTPDGGRQLTLLTNGQLQGGDSASEMKAQYGYALYPLLHTTARDSALAIGLGTGVSAATVRWAGFRHLDVAEFSGDLARLTDTYFGDVTGRILRQPGVDLHITDGRNFLLLANHKYDLVTIEVSHIWFAGAASLYDRELYQLVKARLSSQGVLQQWLPLHRIGFEDIVSILGTVRSEFPRVWLYFSGSSGIIVTCSHDCEPTPATLARIESAPDLAGPLSSLLGSSGTSGSSGSVSVSGGASRLVADRVLSPETVDRFLADVEARGVAVDQLLSTDDNRFLEYSTPRGNVRDHEASLRANVAILRSYSPASLTSGTKLKSGDLSPPKKEKRDNKDERGLPEQ